MKSVAFTGFISLKHLLMLSALLFSQKLLAHNFPVEIFEYIDDIKIVAFINETDIDKSLQWQPFATQPPLTIKNVLIKMKKYLAVEKLAIKSPLLTQIELKQIPHHPGNWHYLVSLKSKSNENTTTRFHYFIVLMNGKIIPAVKEVESFK